jgi:putative ABC transport system substrate-binding protein
VNRRRVLAALTALAAAPRALAQAKLARVTVLSPIPVFPSQLELFRQGMREFGYREDRNLILTVLSADGNQQVLDRLAGEVARAKPDVIVAVQTPAVAAAKKATGAIPIVMVAGDPVGTGLVASLARPGSNVTGVSTTTGETAVKNLEMIRDIRPKASRVAVLANAVDPFTTSFLAQLNDAGQKLGVELRVAMVRSPKEYDALFAEWEKLPVDAVIVQPSLPRERAIELALKHKLASLAPARAFAEAGGLIAYSSSPKEYMRRAAGFVDRILKGGKPGEMPIEQPTLLELVVNLKTAKALGITFPAAIIARADSVVE